MKTRSPHLDAIRLLFVIRAGAEPYKDSDMTDVVSLFRGKARLLAFDFWMRNPDYLADELLNLFDKTGAGNYLHDAQAIFKDEEPDLRRFPMIRYRFGAFDRLDDALSLLRCRDLIRIRLVLGINKAVEAQYLMTKAGEQFSSDCLREEPILAWYADRAQLVSVVAGSDGGTALKKRQYERLEYAETELGGTIPSIAGNVRTRLQALKAPLQD